MMKTLAVRSAVLALVVLATTAHVGSPDVWFEGPAGAYRVLVHVQAPPVVPGIAIINVKVEGASRVTAFVNKFDATGGTPPPDVAVPVPDNPGWYRTQLWIMTDGSNGVTVSVEGASGSGSVVVPITAVAARRLPVSNTLIAIMIAAGLFLFYGLVSIIGASVRESVLPPGEAPDESRQRRARLAMLRTVGVWAVILAAMGIWWRVSDAEFRSTLFRPLEVTTAIDGGTRPSLSMTIIDSTWTHRHDYGWMRTHRRLQFSNLIEDHGKLVHMFLTAADGRAFAHLHPSTSDSVTFTTPLPPLPAGTYHVFADIIHESGFAQTLVSTVDLPSPTNMLDAWSTDADDSWSMRHANGAHDRVSLQDGTQLRWLRPSHSIAANAEAGLRFVIDRPPGDGERLEPYLGMLGHAAVVRDDASVFIHLHPLGTISMAAQSRLAQSSAASSQHAMHRPSTSDTLYFPYAFPRVGSYTVWVQVKRKGRVLTGAVAVSVTP